MIVDLRQLVVHPSKIKVMIFNVSKGSLSYYHFSFYGTEIQITTTYTYSACSYQAHNLVWGILFSPRSTRDMVHFPCLRGNTFRPSHPRRTSWTWSSDLLSFMVLRFKGLPCCPLTRLEFKESKHSYYNVWSVTNGQLLNPASRQRMKPILSTSKLSQTCFFPP